MEKFKAGLHKEISSIFNGVPIAKDSGVQAPTCEPPQGCPTDGSDDIYPAQQSPPPQPQQPAQPIPTHSPTKQPDAKADIKTTVESPPPQPQQPAQPMPTHSPTKQPEAKADIKTTVEIPRQQIWETIKIKLLTPKPGVSASRQIATVIFVPILSFVFIFMFARALKTQSSGTTAPLQSAAGSTFASSKGGVDWRIPEPYPSTLRDPMRIQPAVTSLSNSTNTQSGIPIIRGIVYSQENPSALIGNKIVHEGDKVFGATVSKISRDSVQFEKDGKKWTQKVDRKKE